MFLVRDIMYCKPGQVRPMVQKFLALDKLGRQMGFGADAGDDRRLCRALLDGRLGDGNREHREVHGA